MGRTAAKGTYVERILKSALVTCKGSAKPRVCTVTSQGHQAKTCAPKNDPTHHCCHCCHIRTTEMTMTVSWPLSGGARVYHPNRPLDFCHLITNNQKKPLLYWLSLSFISIFFKQPSLLLSISFHTSPKSTVLIRTLRISLRYCWHSGPDLLAILCTWTNPSHNLSHQTFSGGISL